LPKIGFKPLYFGCPCCSGRSMKRMNTFFEDQVEGVGSIYNVAHKMAKISGDSVSYVRQALVWEGFVGLVNNYLQRAFN
jgi:hypothetical protein